jgi:hypothetical protein
MKIRATWLEAGAGIRLARRRARGDVLGENLMLGIAERAHCQRSPPNR